MNDKWDNRFLEVADLISTWSKDPSTKVGCVIVTPGKQIVTTGFNGFPRGIKDSEDRLIDRTKKYPLIVHSEENALLQASRVGVSVFGCILYTTLHPCSKCARMIIQAGIGEVVIKETDIQDRWKEDMQLSKEMFSEAQIIYRQIG